VQGALLALIVFSVWGTLLVRGTGMLIFTLLALVWRLERCAEIGPGTVDDVPVGDVLSDMVAEADLDPVQSDEPLAEATWEDEPDESGETRT